MKLNDSSLNIFQGKYNAPAPFEIIKKNGKLYRHRSQGKDMTLKQSLAVHIQALVSADVILLGSSSKLRLLFINLVSVPGGQLINSPTAQSLDRWLLLAQHSKN